MEKGGEREGRKKMYFYAQIFIEHGKDVIFPKNGKSLGAWKAECVSRTAFAA